jgi:hypothetical protein
MSTFNQVFCDTLYENGALINPQTLRGDPGITTSTITGKGDPGKNGKLLIGYFYTQALTMNVPVPDPLTTDIKILHIIKKVDSAYDIPVLTHLNVQIAKLYKTYDQEVILYKRDNEWVF